jgi:hypothetical protein
MTKKKHKCKQCGKIITGKVKLVTYRKKLGGKSINVVEFYDERCFLARNKESSLHECNKKGRICKKGHCKKARLQRPMR